MNGKTQIVWRGTPSSEALEARIRDEVAALEDTGAELIAARVVVEAPPRSHRHGGHFQIKVELTVPGKVINITRDPPANANAEDAYAAVNDAFAAARRQLVDYVQVRRGEVKRHAG